jgi:hypothetical protein
MKAIRAYIAAKQGDFGHHPFFARLRDEERGVTAARFIPRLAFWVMAFQDILRLNEQRISEPRMRKIARHHRAEDAGHDAWFLSDLAALGVQEPNVAQLFSTAHASTRDAAYALVAEVFRAERDHERITLLFCLEASGHVFFEASASYFERVAAPQAIKYFSRHHITVEKDHEMFEQQLTAHLESLVLSPEEQRRAHAMIDRIHAAFLAMFDGLLAVLTRLSELPPPARDHRIECV